MKWRLFLWEWSFILVAAAGTRVVVWTDDLDRVEGDESRGYFRAEELRLAGLMRCNQENVSNNYCRDKSCEFVYEPIPILEDMSGVDAAGMRRSHQDADVLVVLVNMIKSLMEQENKSFLVPLLLPRQRRKALRVSYWREALSGRGISPEAQREMFDLSMGINIHSSIINPSFFPPVDDEFAQLPSGLPGYDDRPGVAVFVSSHCGAQPRTHYLAKLERYLDVDIYGKCGDKVIGGSESNETLVDVMSRYKFYLSFENTISPGYVTEKLLSLPLQAGIVPVYLGAPDADYLSYRFWHRSGKSITKDKQRKQNRAAQWFVNVADFDTPHHLSKFLTKMKKHTWDSYVAAHQQHVQDDRLNFWLRAPEPIQLAINKSRQDSLVDRNHFHSRCPHTENGPKKTFYAERVAAACQLCDLSYLQRQLEHYVPNEPHLTDFRCLFETNCTCGISTYECT